MKRWYGHLATTVVKNQWRETDEKRGEGKALAKGGGSERASGERENSSIKRSAALEVGVCAKSDVSPFSHSLREKNSTVTASASVSACVCVLFFFYCSHFC